MERELMTWLSPGSASSYHGSDHSRMVTCRAGLFATHTLTNLSGWELEKPNLPASMWQRFPGNQ